MLQQVISVSLLAAMAAIPPASSQGIKSGSTVARTITVMPALRVLVATPFPNSPSDSANAVLLGNALRTKVGNSIDGNDWQVITRREMNDQLVKWGYGADQPFPPEMARQMVTPMSARMFVMTTMTKGSDGHYAASVRVTGASDEAGEVFKLTQGPTQSLQDFGNKLGEQVINLFKAYPDARQCNDNIATNKAKAVEGANKALKAIPNYGFAEFCLGLIEWAKDSTSAETVRHFKNAAEGDPLSIKALARVAVIQQLKKDTAGVIASYQNMLIVAPTNRLLADEAIRVFKQWGRPDAADSVIENQIRLDPTNPDWHELKGNSCAARAVGESDAGKAKPWYRCAYDSFTEEYKLDPTRADTNFYPRMVFVAPTRTDSMQWAKRWAEKFSSISDPYKLELSLYMDAGQTDSAKGVIRVLGAIDPSDATPVLALEQAFLKKGQLEDAASLGPLLPKGVDANGKNQFAGQLVQAGQTLIADTLNHTEAKDSTLARVGHALVSFNSPNVQYTEFGNYFVAFSYTAALTRLSSAARADKSCDTVNKYEALLNAMDTEPAFKALSTATTKAFVDYSTQILQTVQAEKTGAQALPAMKKAYCHQ